MCKTVLYFVKDIWSCFVHHLMPIDLPWFPHYRRSFCNVPMFHFFFFIIVLRCKCFISQSSRRNQRNLIALASRIWLLCFKFYGSDLNDRWICLCLSLIFIFIFTANHGRLSTFFVQSATKPFPTDLRRLNEDIMSPLAGKTSSFILMWSYISWNTSKLLRRPICK